MDALGPGQYWFKKLELLEAYQKAYWDEWKRSPTLPHIPLPEPFESQIVNKRAVEILQAERKRIREAENERFAEAGGAEKWILEFARSPYRMAEPVYAGLVERWAWSNPKHPLSFYSEDLKAIKKALHEGKKVRFTWQPKTKREPETGALADAKRDIEDFERDYRPYMEPGWVYAVEWLYDGEDHETEKRRRIQEEKEGALAYLLQNGHPSVRWPVTFYVGMETVLG